MSFYALISDLETLQKSQTMSGADDQRIAAAAAEAGEENDDEKRQRPICLCSSLRADDVSVRYPCLVSVRPSRVRPTPGWLSGAWLT